MIAYYLYPLFFLKKKFDASFSTLSPFDCYCNDANPNQTKQEIYQKLHRRTTEDACQKFLDKLNMGNFQLHRVWKWAMANSMHLQNSPNNTISPDSHLTMRALTDKWTSLFFLPLVWRPGGKQQQCQILCSDADLSL